MKVWILVAFYCCLLGGVHVVIGAKDKNGENKDNADNAGDFAWDIIPNGKPVVKLDPENAQREIQLQYLFTGSLNDSKFLQPELYEWDCQTKEASSETEEEETDPMSTSHQDGLELRYSIDGNQLTVDVDILFESIADSPQYFHVDETDPTHAIISFCVRVDYNFRTNDNELMSINFHENQVTVHVDLTSQFELTDIHVDHQEEEDSSPDNKGNDTDNKEEGEFEDNGRL